MHIQFPEDLSGVQKMCVIHDSSDHVSKAPTSLQPPILAAPQKEKPRTQPCVNPYLNRGNVLLDVESEEWQIEQKCNPVPIDKEQEGQEAMDGRFRDDICVEAVAEIDRINVVAISFGKLALCSEYKHTSDTQQ